MSPHPSYPRSRLYVTPPLSPGAEIPLTGSQAHYLLQVLRGKAGDTVALFNGVDGEWQAGLADVGKKTATLSVQKQLRPQTDAADLWLLCAPLKGGRSEWVVEKATELGVSRICPVLTRFTVPDRINEVKFSTIAIEAAEQCERLTVPVISPLTPLATILGAWPKARTLIYGDESGASANAAELLLKLAPARRMPGSAERRTGTYTSVREDSSTEATPQTPAGVEFTQGSHAVLVGPEGGFSAEELALLRSLPYVSGMCMGPRILRADTAAVAILALLQAFGGDWEGKPAFRNG